MNDLDRMVTMADDAAEGRGLIRAVPGDVWALDAPPDPPPVWGRGPDVLWSGGEPLYIVGPIGASKTTLAHNLLLHLLGLRFGDVLGYPVQAATGRVLYVAADRPRQIRRSWLRFVGENDRGVMAERLRMHDGPLADPLNTAAPTALRDAALGVEASVIIVDSLKDVALRLSEDETGSAVSMALQHCVAADIDVLVLHHQRKAGSGDTKKPTQLADVYGSTWLTASAGSVVLLWVEAAGDSAVELSHLKPPKEAVGPLSLTVDPDAGSVRLDEQPDPLRVLRAHPTGLTAAEAAPKLYGTTTGKQKVKSDTEKARRRFERLVAEGLVTRDEHEPPRDEAGRVMAGRGDVVVRYRVRAE